VSFAGATNLCHMVCQTSCQMFSFVKRDARCAFDGITFCACELSLHLQHPLKLMPHYKYSNKSSMDDQNCCSGTIIVQTNSKTPNVLCRVKYFIRLGPSARFLPSYESASQLSIIKSGNFVLIKGSDLFFCCVATKGFNYHSIPI